MPNEKSTKHAPTVLVSACLLGIPCRYDGKSKPNDLVLPTTKTLPIFPSVRNVTAVLIHRDHRQKFRRTAPSKPKKG